MSHLDDLHEVKNHIKALRILVAAASVLMFLCVSQGHNSLGLMFLGLAIVFICILSHKHDDRIYIEQLHAPVTGE